MSEAMDAASLQSMGETYAVAYPGQEFSGKLERFYSDTRRQLGGHALSLTSDSRLRVFRESLPDDFKKYNPDTITLKELSAMQTNLRRRGIIHPIVDNTVGVEPERNRMGKIAEQPGIVLRFNILVDRLTAQAIQGSGLVDGNLAIPMHLVVHRHQMRLGAELLEARDDLLASLNGTPPLTIENLHLHSP